MRGILALDSEAMVNIWLMAPAQPDRALPGGRPLNPPQIFDFDESSAYKAALPH
jgi:hypothetical protein